MGDRKLRLGWCSVFFLWSVSGATAQRIEAFGDSLTAGFVSDTHLTEVQDLKKVSGIVSDLAMFFVTKDRTYIEPYQYKSLAWPALVGETLGVQTGSAIAVENRASSGARIHDLSTQIASMAPGSAVRAFFFIGHNDLCRNLSSPQELAEYFQGWYIHALSAWDARHTDSVAYVLPLADMHRVYESLQNYVWFQNDQTRYACEDSWEKLFPYCRSHFHKLRDKTLHSFFVPRLAAINAAIENSVREMGRRSTRNRFKFLTQTPAMPYRPSFFAVDCYHLSAQGQKALAQNVLEGELFW